MGNDQTSTPARNRDGYFFWMSWLILACVLFGFAPTYYLRPVLDAPPIPTAIYVHGAIMSAWFIWFALQTSLVRFGHSKLHRKTGVAGAVIAGAVLFGGPLATVVGVGRVKSRFGIDWETDMSALPHLGIEDMTLLEFMARLVWGNFSGIAIFLLLVSLALWKRKAPQWHKRLMLLASLAILVPALARISRLPGLGGEDGLFIPVVWIGLVLSVAVHDAWTKRKLHPATMVGIGMIFVAGLGAPIFAQSEPWLEFTRWLGGG